MPPVRRRFGRQPAPTRGIVWSTRIASPAIRIDSLQITKAADWQSVPEWRDALEDPEGLASATLLKQDVSGKSWVRRATIRGQDVVIKCRELGSWWKRVKGVLGGGQARRQWRGAEVLQREGIATGRPLLAASATIDGRPCELLILEFVPGTTVLDTLAQIAGGSGPDIRAQHQIARAIGSQLAKFGKRIHNRDHKPSNLVITSSPDQRVAIAVIDCVGVKRPLMCRAPATVVKSLVLEPLGCGVLPRRALRARVVCAFAQTSGLKGREGKLFRKSLWWLVDLRVRRHGDPRPRVSPLRSS